jgi:hypothetical protein
MNWDAILTGLWQVVNSVPAIMTMAALLGWLLTKLYAIRPAWEAYEGTIISAIKHAEKAVPDDSPNKAVARLDEALRYVLKVYAETNRGQPPSDVVVRDLREGIQVTHDRLESRGTL